MKDCDEVLTAGDFCEADGVNDDVNNCTPNYDPIMGKYNVFWDNENEAGRDYADIFEWQCPDQDCQGSWSDCTDTCERTFTETQSKTGEGADCPTEGPGCTDGDGDCVQLCDLLPVDQKDCKDLEEWDVSVGRTNYYFGDNFKDCGDVLLDKEYCEGDGVLNNENNCMPTQVMGKYNVFWGSQDASGDDYADIFQWICETVAPPSTCATTFVDGEICPPGYTRNELNDTNICSDPEENCDLEDVDRLSCCTLTISSLSCDF
eukprot:UN31747